MKSYRGRKAEDAAEFGPKKLGKRTSVYEMVKGLNGGAVVTAEIFRGEMEDATAKRKGIHEELVPGRPVPRKERRAPDPLPDVRRGG